MLGDFMVKKHKFGMEICIYLKIGLVEMKCGLRWLITILCITNVQKDFKIQLLKISFFLTKSPQIMHTYKNCNFNSIIGTF